MGNVWGSAVGCIFGGKKNAVVATANVAKPVEVEAAPVVVVAPAKKKKVVEKPVLKIQPQPLKCAAPELTNSKAADNKNLVTLTTRAVHPLFLDAIAQLEVDMPDGRGKMKVGDLYTYEVVKYFVRPHTAASGVSLIETLWEIENGNKEFDATNVTSVLHKYNSCVGAHFTKAAAPRPYFGQVNYFLSHAWSYRFGHLRDMVKQHYESVTGSEHKYVPLFYWVDIFAVSQNFEGDFKRHPDGDFPAVIKQSQGVVFTIYPWQEPIAPTRIWCLFEALTAVDLDVSLELLLDAQFKKEKVPLLNLKQRFLDSVVKALDVRKAEATVESDRQYVMGLLTDRKGGLDGFNKLMRQMLESRMLEALLLRVITTQGADGGTQIVNEGATFHTKQLRFKIGRVPDTSIELIAKALVGNKIVTSLDLSPPHQKGLISHKGAHALMAALAQNDTLTELDLTDNPLHDVGVMEITEALQHSKQEPANKVQRISAAPGKDSGKNSSICALQTLRLCRVGLEDRGIDALADVLAVNKTLTSLDISYNSEASAESLADFFKVLHTNTTLKSLNLSGLTFGAVSDATFKALPEMIEANKSLESLSLCACHLNQRACKRLADAVGKSQLKVLDATGNLFGESAAEGLAEAIGKNAALRELRLKSCEISFADAAVLRTALAKSGISAVDLSGNHFGKEQWEALGKGYHKLNAVVKVDAPKTTAKVEVINVSTTLALSKNIDDMLASQGESQLFKMSSSLSGQKSQGQGLNGQKSYASLNAQPSS